MKALILFTCCQSVVAADWSPVIEALPCICRGVLATAILYFVLKYVCAPLIKNCHERKMKKLQFEHDAQVVTLKDQKQQLEDKMKESEASSDDALKKAKKEAEDQLALEKHKYQLLEKKFKLYEDYFKTLNLEIKSKEK